MNTEHERLIATHKAYKVVARREKKELKDEIDGLHAALKSASAPDVEQINELKAKNEILKNLTMIVTGHLNDKDYIIDLLQEKLDDR